MEPLQTTRPENEALMIQTIEELAELSQALTKGLRALAGDKTLEPGTFWLKMIAEEIGDVEIMIDKIVDYYDMQDAVEVFKKAKISRTEKRLRSLK